MEHTNYKKLIELLQQTLAGNGNTQSSSAIQIYRNHLSTLRGFLAMQGKTEESHIGRELRNGFDNAMHDYVAALTISDRSKRDRRSHLNFIRKLFDELMQADRKEAKDSTPSEFHLALRLAVVQSELPAKTLAKRASISTSAMQRWMKGAVPNQRTIPSVHRLESHLGLPRDNLVRLIPEKTTRCPEAGQHDEIAYRTRLRENTLSTYHLSKNDVSSALMKEWMVFFDHKTSSIPTLKRADNGQWRLIPKTFSHKIPEIACIRGLACPSAYIAWEGIRSFLGFLHLPQSQKGWGLPLSDVQTLAWLAHPEAINDFLRFIQDRSGNLVHGTHKRIAQFVKMLVNVKTGFLFQQPHFYELLPNNYRDPAVPWTALCGKADSVARGWLRTAHDVSRKPADPISSLLALQDPLKPILLAIEEIDRMANAAPPGSISEARLKRDALLLSLLVSNPLRIRNIATMTWTRQNTGNIYHTTNNLWRLRLDPSQLKNGHGKETSGYDVKIATWVEPRLEAYLEEFRDRLLDGRESLRVFVSSSKNPDWNDISRHITKLTRRHIPGCPGFGPHAFRHLVASDWLTKNSNDFLTVAILLNDRLETVMKNYAHLKRDVGFDRYETYLMTVRDKVPMVA